MPRNGSGVYSADWVNAAPNTTIESAKANAMVADLVSDANAARPITAGGTGGTSAATARTALAVPGLATENVFTKTQIWAKGADVASAASLPVIDDGNYFDVTGTTTVTSIATVGVGAVIKLHFDGILTLTYHATDLILPGAANITTAAGDEAEFIEYATGDWRCVNYTRASGRQVVPDLRYETSQSLSGSSTVTFSSLPAGAFRVTLAITSLSTNGTSTPFIQIGDAGGLETTGYAGPTTFNINAVAPTVGSSTGGMLLMPSGIWAATYSLGVVVTMVRVTGDVWAMSFTGGTIDADRFVSGFSQKSLTQALDRIAIITGNTFDAGTANLIVEYA